MLRVEHLKIGALPPMSFQVADGECFSVEGPSGAGKTRLLRALADLDAAPGQVFLDGEERNEMAPERWRRLVRYAAAEPVWWTDTPRQSFPQKFASGPTLQERLNRLLALLDLDVARVDQPVALLSTGERQRLAFARAIIDEPRVLLLDEPTSSLDAASASLIEELIRFQLLSGRSVVLATHDRGMAGRLAHARLQLAKSEAPAKLAEGRRS